MRLGFVCVVAFLVAAAPAPAALRVVEIPGVRGDFVGSVRLADGGAIAATRSAVVRLRSDGLPSLAYGREGVVGGLSGVTAVMADPASGRAWVGTAGGAVLGFDRRGRRVGSARRVSGRVRALAVRGSSLAVLADGLTVFDGARAEGPMSIEGGCFGSLAYSAQDVLSVAGCSLLSLPSGERVELGDASRALLAPAPGGAACLALRRPAAVELGRWTGSGAPALTSVAVAGDLRAVAPLVSRGCAALVGSRVVQAAGGRATTTTLPRGVVASALFRCRKHVLVLGRRGRTAVVVVVPARA